MAALAFYSSLFFFMYEEKSSARTGQVTSLCKPVGPVSFRVPAERLTTRPSRLTMNALLKAIKTKRIVSFHSNIKEHL